MSLFATSDLARLVAKRNWEVASFTACPRGASSPLRSALPRAPLVRSQEHDGDSFQSWRLQRDLVERRDAQASRRAHLELAAVYTNYERRRSSFLQGSFSRDCSSQKKPIV